MRLQYFGDTDSLYIDFAGRTSAESEEIAPGIVLDYDAEGRVVGIDIQHANEHLNLGAVETIDLPLV